MNWVYWWNNIHIHEDLEYLTPKKKIDYYNQTQARQLAPV